MASNAALKQLKAIKSKMTSWWKAEAAYHQVAT